MPSEIRWWGYLREKTGNKGNKECGGERGNETLMETDRSESCWKMQRQDANMMSSSFC